MKSSYIIILVLLVIGCSSAEERAQKRAQKEIDACVSRGIAPETPEFDKCRAEMRRAEQKRREERMQGTDDLHSPSAQRAHRW